MNSKERVKVALSKKVPDKIPYGEYAFDFDTVSSVIGHETYYRAKAKSQIAFWEGRRDEVVQSWKEDSVEFYTKIDCIDIINNGCMAGSVCPPKGYIPKAPKRLDDNTWEDDKGRVYKLSDVTMDITMVFDPHQWDREYKKEDYEDEIEYLPPDKSVFEVVDFIIQKFGNEKFILGPSGDEVGMVLLGGMERGLTEYVYNTETIKAAAKKEITKANMDDFHYIRKGVDGIIWGQDFSYKAGPLISPETFRKFVFPVLKERARHIKENFDLPIIKHACGNNWKLLDMFVDIGFDCYQSIQSSADMDISRVKHEYGDKIALWGGMPVEALVSGTTEEVRKAVRASVESARQKGGFIFGASHSVAVGTKYDNFMAMLDEFVKVRDY